MSFRESCFSVLILALPKKHPGFCFSCQCVLITVNLLQDELAVEKLHYLWLLPRYCLKLCMMGFLCSLICRFCVCDHLSSVILDFSSIQPLISELIFCFKNLMSNCNCWFWLLCASCYSDGMECFRSFTLVVGLLAQHKYTSFSETSETQHQRCRVCQSIEVVDVASCRLLLPPPPTLTRVGVGLK